MSNARGHAGAFWSLVTVVVFVVFSVLFESSSARLQALPSNFEEFLFSLGRNEVEPVTEVHQRQTTSEAEGTVHSVDGASAGLAGSPDGVTLSDRQTTFEEADNEDGEEGDDNLNGQTSNELLSYFRYVPREHWSCCMLGLLAGNKGFQCRAEFYSSRMTLRNFNRPQNGRHSGGPSSGRDRTRNYDIIRTFRRCVSNNAHEFHRCCYVAATERRELRVARNYRRNMASRR